MKQKKISNIWDSLMLALLLNMNALRFVFKIHDDEGGILLYGIYVLYFASAFRHLLKRQHRAQSHVQITGICFVGCVIIALITSFFTSGNAIFEAVKFVILFAILFVTFYIPGETIYRSINISIFINIIYSVIVIADPVGVNDYMTHSGNYLVLTLPLSLMLSITLNRLVCSIALGCNCVRSSIFNTLYSVVLFFGITGFASRSAYLFPFLCALIMPVIASKRHRGRLLKIYLLLAVFIGIAVYLFFNYANVFTVNRMIAFLSDVGSNVRVEIWRKCIDYIFNKGWFLLGGGINALENEIGYYPHNIVLQYVSEMGVIGLSLCVSATYAVYRSMKVYLTKQLTVEKDPREALRFLDVLCAVLFLVMNFMKSFSIYDGLVLYTYMVFLFNVSSLRKNEDRGS